MQNIMTKKSETGPEHVLSQFELTKKVLNNLKHFKLSPTTINVLWYLTSCYNPKHGYVFPKQSTIAENLRCSERSVVRAIQSLVKEGLIIVECKYINRYRFTSRLIGECAQNLSDDKGQFDIKGDNLTFHEMKQKTVTKKEQTVKKSLTVDSNSIEFEGFKILKDYAQKNYTSTPEKYLNWILKHKDVQKKILFDYKAKENAKKRALRSIEKTQELLEQFRGFENTAAEPTQSWQELGKKIKALRKQS
jgi:DNA-binding Lrp family transcriptional regulator